MMENALMRQKLIVKAVCLALVLPAGIALAGPIAKVKPDTLLAVDMNRSAIIDGVVANFKSQLTPNQEKVLRDTLSTLRADRLMAASLAPSFDGLLTVLKSDEKMSTVSEKVNAKAAGFLQQFGVVPQFIGFRLFACPYCIGTEFVN